MSIFLSFTKSQFITLLGLLKLIRFPNLIIIVFTQLFTSIFLIHEGKVHFFNVINDIKFLFLIISTNLVAAAGYIINDYYDVKIDAFNKPKELVVDRLIGRRIALLLHMVMNIIGLFLSVFVGLKLAIVTFSVIFFLWIYSNNLKRKVFVGNLLIALLTALSLIIVALYYNKNTAIVMYYAFFSFLITLAREIIKDMEDIPGDELHGCKTLPIVYGIKKTKNIIYIILFVLILSLLIITLKINSLGLYFVVFLETVLLFYIYKELYFADKKKDFKHLGQLCKIVMVVGIISMIFFQK
jgi:4-hydroxybenzoate polyprenyltransferase